MKELKKKIRREVLLASYAAKACHIGSALSCLDILVDLYFKIMKDNDVFIFSKASGASALYAVLAEKGHFPKDKLTEYIHDYPEASVEVPGVVHSVGSIGHGLAVATGMAYADRTRDVYCLISDGEVQEGVTYECALFANQHNLTNLKVIVDYNRLQALGNTSDIISVYKPLELLTNLFPDMTIKYTLKGEGVSFMEDKYEWHYKNLTQELLEQALEENA